MNTLSGKSHGRMRKYYYSCTAHFSTIIVPNGKKQARKCPFYRLLRAFEMSQGKSLYPVWGNLVYSDYRDKGLYPETTIAMNTDSSLKIKRIPISL